LNVNTVSTVNGIDKNSVGTNDTRATNHVCNRYSRHAKGRRNMHTNVSNAMAKKPPSPRKGLAANPIAVTYLTCRTASPHLWS
jgi:hypothetical protein